MGESEAKASRAAKPKALPAGAGMELSTVKQPTPILTPGDQPPMHAHRLCSPKPLRSQHLLMVKRS